MITLDELYTITDNEKIELKRLNLENSDGLYININDKNLIILNSKIDNYCLEKCTLAEELGHYFTGVIPTPPFANDYYLKLQRSKNEFKALKWCASKLIPFDTLKSFLERNMSKFDIINEVDITEDFINRVYNLYENKLKGCD